MSDSRVRAGVTLVALAAAYFVLGRLGLLLAFVNESASPVWPPSGFAIGALLVFGLRAWPAVAVGAFAVNVTNSGAAAVSLGIAAGNTLEAVAGAWLTTRVASGRDAFDSTGNVVRFAVIAAGVSAIAASAGVLSLLAGGLAAQADAGAVWFTWWLGDTTGAILVAPIVVLWAGHAERSLIARRPAEFVLLVAVLIAASIAVFGAWPAGRSTYPLEFVVIPVLLWSAFRFGARETALVAAVLVAIAVDGTVRGYGPFARSSPNESLLLLQTFVAVITTMMLAVAAEVAARRAVARELTLLNDDLERHVTSRTDELLKANERLLEAQEVAHVGSWEWDIDLNRVWWSAEMYRIYGLEHDAPIGYERFLRHVHPDDQALVDASVRRAMADGLPFTFDHRIVRPDGTIRVLHAAGRVIAEASGRPVRMVGTGTDVTARKEAEEARAQLIAEQAAREEAEASSRAKDEFLAILSHELRTPLNAALGWAHMLRESPPETPRSRQAVETIYRNLLVQARLVSDIVDVTRIGKNALVLDKTHLDLPAVVQSAIAMVSERAAARGITIQSRIECGHVEVLGDARRLEQVFWNLLSNAVRFGREGGRISVEAVMEQGAVAITVDDDGPGIDPAFLPYVFEPFRQADASPRRSHDGLGLGLAIARHLVELHGGTIAAENGPLGGARLSVRLPVHAVIPTA